MTPNNNLSILPFYEVTSANPTPRECQKWWNYGRVWPLITPGIPPIQIAGSVNMFEIYPWEPNTGQSSQVAPLWINSKIINGQNYDYGNEQVSVGIQGRYYIATQIDGKPYVSDVFTVVSEAALDAYLKLEWWDDNDFIMDAGAIVYKTADVTVPLSFDGSNYVASKYINAYGGLSSSTSWNVFYFPCRKRDVINITRTGSISTQARSYTVYSTNVPSEFSAQTAIEVGSVIAAGETTIEITDDAAKMIAITISSGTAVPTTATKTTVIPPYKNVLYLPTDIAKPEYVFEEEGENRDGYFFPIKQISEKRYRFKFLAPEYILDIMRFIRMSDHIQITYKGQVYNADTFLMTPTWEAQGDLASVECEFDTDTVAKKIGRLITP